MLLRKMLRDMNHHKTQFLSIFLMAFLGVFIYAGVGGEWYGLKKTVENYYSETNLADIWLYGKGFSKEDIDKVSHVNGIKDVQGRMSIDGIGSFDNNPELKLHFIDVEKISKFVIMKGEEFSIDKDGIWLDDRFSEAKNLELGDILKFKINGINMEMKILGFIQNPEYVYTSGKNDMVPNHNNYGFAYLSYKSLPEGMNIVYTDMLITTYDKNYSKVEDKIDETLEGHYSVLINRDNFPSYTVFDGEIKQHKAMGEVFPIAFLSIAMLTILTTMTRIVNNQRIQIGTLKALGFKKSKILSHYVSFGFWVPLLGACLGAVIGPISLPYLFYDSLKTAYTLPQWKPSISVMFLFMAVISVSMCTIVTYIACKNVLNDTPSETLRPKSPNMMKHNFFSKSKIWAKLSFNAQWNLRDVFRSKVRSIMAVVGVMGCIALLVCAFGMKDSLDDIITWQYSDINSFNTKITLDEKITNDQIANIIKQTKGEKLMEGAIEIKANGKKKSGELLVNDEVSLIKATNPERKFINLPQNGIAMSFKLANNLGLKKGDEFQWHIYGDEKWIDGTVDAIYRTPISQGITVNKDYFERQGYLFSATSIVTKDKNNENMEGVIAMWSKEDLAESYNTMSEAMNILVYILIFGAVILAVVVLYNLGVISFVERERELATLKVIGFKSMKIRRLLLTQTIWLTIIGMILGAPFGKWLIDYMCSFLGDSFDMMTIINLKSYLYSIVITLGLSVLVNLMFSRKVKNIDMVSSLKGVE